MNRSIRFVVAVMSALLLTVGLLGAATSSASAAAVSKKTCEARGYKIKVKFTTIRNEPGRSYGQIRTFGKAGSPTELCTYVLKAKKDRNKATKVTLIVAAFGGGDPDNYNRVRSVKKVKVRSRSLTYTIVPQKRDNDYRAFITADVRIDGQEQFGSSLIR